jgi:hypothetical protein
MTIELLSRVTHEFDSPDSPMGLEINNELLSPVTRGFDSPFSPSRESEIMHNCCQG